MFRGKKSVIFICIVISFFQFNLYPANINVSTLELISHVIYNDSQDYAFTLQTDGEMELTIQGGYKFGASIIFGFINDDIENAIKSKTAGLLFKSATIMIREILGGLLSFSFYIGRNDVFCSGEGFINYFGTDNIETNYSGFIYFPEGPTFEGIHTVSGTGISFSIRPVSDVLQFTLYAYQDDHFVDGLGDLLPGRFSIDLRTIINLDPVKFDLFIGASGPNESEAGYYRAGLLFYLKAGPVEFYQQAGIPRWDPIGDVFSIEMLYLLTEIKLNLGIISIIPSAFIYPQYYLQNPTNEEGIMDLNLKFAFGNIDKHLVSGGIEGNCSFTENLIENPVIKMSPFFSFITPGVLWELKCGITVFSDPLPYNDIPGMFEGFIGIKAEF